MTTQTSLKAKMEKLVIFLDKETRYKRILSQEKAKIEVPSVQSARKSTSSKRMTCWCSITNSYPQ